jgi:hypothetical protein
MRALLFPRRGGQVEVRQSPLRLQVPCSVGWAPTIQKSKNPTHHLHSRIMQPEPRAAFNRLTTRQRVSSDDDVSLSWLLLCAALPTLLQYLDCESPLRPTIPLIIVGVPLFVSPYTAFPLGMYAPLSSSR